MYKTHIYCLAVLASFYSDVVEYAFGLIPNWDRPDFFRSTTMAKPVINPFMPNVISHLYQLDESISNFRGVG